MKFDAMLGKTVLATLGASALLALIAIFGQDYATAMTANLPFAKEAALCVLGAAGAAIYALALIAGLRLAGVSLKGLRRPQAQA